MDYNKVWSLQHKYGLSNVRMAEICGLKRSQSYTDMMERESMKVVYLEKICDYFKISPSEFMSLNEKTEDPYENSKVLQESSTPTYSTHPCPSCEAKSETIEVLKKSNTDLLDRIKHLEKVIDNCLSPVKKGTGT